MVRGAPLGRPKAGPEGSRLTMRALGKRLTGAPALRSMVVTMMVVIMLMVVMMLMIVGVLVVGEKLFL